MFTIALVDFAKPVAREKFLEIFGEVSPLVIEDMNADAKMELEDKIFEMLSFIDIFNIEAYLTISHSETHRAQKLDSVEDFYAFIDESVRLSGLNAEDTPSTGNFWASMYEDPSQPTDIYEDGKLILRSLADPDDIDEVEFKQGKLEVPPTVSNDLDIATNNDFFANLSSVASDGVAFAYLNESRERLISLGASFPYLTEEQLQRDFECLSRLDEVEDSDLINLLQMGYGEIKDGAQKTASVVSQVGKAIIKPVSKEAREERAQKRADGADKIARLTDEVAEILQKARHRNDEHITRAYSRVAQVKILDKRQAEKLKEKIREKNQRLRPERH